MTEWPNRPVQRPGDPPGGGPQPCSMAPVSDKKDLKTYTSKVKKMDLATAQQTLLDKYAFEARLVEENKQLRDGKKEKAHVNGYTANLLPQRDGLVNYMQTVSLEGVERFVINVVMNQEGK